MTLSEDRLRGLLKEFRVAMIVTRTDNRELHARPMAIADVDMDGTLWLLTDRNSAKMEEIAQDSHVAVTMQSSTQFVAVSGHAVPIEDREKIGQLWNEAWKVWFPGGKDDANLILIKIQGENGEYWDNSGFRGIKYLIEAGKAYLNGTRPDVATDPTIHGKVSL